MHDVMRGFFPSSSPSDDQSIVLSHFFGKRERLNLGIRRLIKCPSEKKGQRKLRRILSPSHPLLESGGNHHHYYHVMIVHLMK